MIYLVALGYTASNSSTLSSSALLSNSSSNILTSTNVASSWSRPSNLAPSSHNSDHSTTSPLLSSVPSSRASNLAPIDAAQKDYSRLGSAGPTSITAQGGSLNFSAIRASFFGSSLKGSASTGSTPKGGPSLKGSSPTYSSATAPILLYNSSGGFPSFRAGPKKYYNHVISLNTAARPSGSITIGYPIQSGVPVKFSNTSVRIPFPISRGPAGPIFAVKLHCQKIIVLASLNYVGVEGIVQWLPALMLTSPTNSRFTTRTVLTYSLPVQNHAPAGTGSKTGITNMLQPQ